MSALVCIARGVWILALINLVPITLTNAAKFAGPSKLEVMTGLGFGAIFFFLVDWRASQYESTSHPEDSDVRDRIGQ